MRTTLTIDDDIYAVARHLALLKNVAIGKAVSELARAGLNQRAGYSADNGMPVFSVSEKVPIFGLQDVQAAEDDF